MFCSRSEITPSSAQVPPRLADLIDFKYNAKALVVVVVVNLLSERNPRKYKVPHSPSGTPIVPLGDIYRKSLLCP